MPVTIDANIGLCASMGVRMCASEMPCSIVYLYCVAFMSIHAETSKCNSLHASNHIYYTKLLATLSRVVHAVRKCLLSVHVYYALCDTLFTAHCCRSIERVHRDNPALQQASHHPCRALSTSNAARSHLRSPSTTTPPLTNDAHQNLPCTNHVLGVIYLANRGCMGRQCDESRTTSSLPTCCTHGYHA